MNPGDEVAGFRLVRLLGDGTRSRVFLGHNGARSVAIKLFRPEASPESVDDEIAALSSASHAHVVQLREVGTVESGRPFLVLERLEAATLGSILGSRSRVTAGEAVTILAPIAAAVGALHSSGVVHGSIAPGRVLFRATGAPVLAGFGHASLFVPPTSAVVLASSRLVLEDRQALSRLVQSVVSRIHEPAGPIMPWLTSLEREGYPDTFIETLVERIFSLGQATPVRFVPPAATVVPEPSPVLTSPRDPTAPWRRLLDRLPTSIAVALAAARGVRRPVWVAAAVGLGSLVAALLLVPPAERGEAAQSPATSATPAPGSVDSVVTGDDPVAALIELHSERERCIRDLSVLCLENVVQSGSAAMDDDAALIRSIEAGGTTGALPALADESLVLVERHGDAALLAYELGPNSEPASVLLVKGEAGWRIRDYLAG